MTNAEAIRLVLRFARNEERPSLTRFNQALQKINNWAPGLSISDFHNRPNVYVPFEAACRVEVSTASEHTVSPLAVKSTDDEYPGV
jgi:hypothetical protein